MSGWRKRQVLEMTLPDHLVSPFDWKKNKEPTAFAKDPYFRGTHKVPPANPQPLLRNIAGKI
jgi:hypothetical protein